MLELINCDYSIKLMRPYDFDEELSIHIDSANIRRQFWVSGAGMQTSIHLDFTLYG